MGEMLFTTLILLVGFVIGYFSKGISVTINHSKEDLPLEYNDSLIDELPDDVQLYYQQNKGVKF